jgi:hypothetical protein
MLSGDRLGERVIYQAGWNVRKCPAGLLVLGFIATLSHYVFGVDLADISGLLVLSREEFHGK